MHHDGNNIEYSEGDVQGEGEDIRFLVIIKMFFSSLMMWLSIKSKKVDSALSVLTPEYSDDLNWNKLRTASDKMNNLLLMDEMKTSENDTSSMKELANMVLKYARFFLWRVYHMFNVLKIMQPSNYIDVEKQFCQLEPMLENKSECNAFVYYMAHIRSYKSRPLVR